MRPLFSLIFLLISAMCCEAQKHTNIWYFGKQAGLDFNFNPPRVLYDGMITSIEGSASVADNNGNLLFYTNGNIIINKDHMTMVNGNQIMGNVSSTNNTIIVPLREMNGMYMLFTVGAAGYLAEGFRYNVIDMNKQGGLGEVTVKNQQIDFDVYEKMAAVRHCNKKDVWIVVRKWETDEYHAYLVSADGNISGPIVSHSGLVVEGNTLNSLGTLKFSPDGSKLVAIHSFENDGAELMRFNNTTGELTDAIYFKPNNAPPHGGFMGVYGAEFSPDSKLLYVSANTTQLTTSVIYQFDVNTHDPNVIVATKQVISSTVPKRGGSLQLGPDNKIYHTMYQDSSLSVIESPNIYGTGCNFQYHKIKMSPSDNELLHYGLPQFIAGDMDERFTPYDFSSQTECGSFEVDFSLNKLTGIDSVKWNFGDGGESTELEPSHVYGMAGEYLVSLTIFRVDCSGNSEVITHSTLAGATSLTGFLPNDTTVCTFEDRIISTTNTAQSYLWNTGATTNAINITEPGLYWLELTRNGCASRDSFRIGLLPEINIDLGKDTSVCSAEPIKIDAGAFDNYLWNTGETQRSIMVSRPGKYKVTVSNAQGCEASDSLIVSWGDCGIFIPSAFTPNGDGLNDRFALVNGIYSEYFRFQVFNRYGQVIFSATDPEQKWDGTFKGKPMPMGSYPWLLTYRKNGFPQSEKGTVMLIR